MSCRRHLGADRLPPPHRCTSLPPEVSSSLARSGGGGGVERAAAAAAAESPFESERADVDDDLGNRDGGADGGQQPA